jgi:hypothetical protein
MKFKDALSDYLKVKPDAKEHKPARKRTSMKWKGS